MTDSPLPEYKYRGARAMVKLHERYLREFVEVWREAKGRNLSLPETKDPDYASLESLLYHVVACARGYMVWMCEQLELPDPAIQSTPEPEALAARVDDYVDHVLAQWRKPLAGVPEEDFNREFPSRWKTVYCVDAMMEHAVMHPIRHTHQLIELAKA